MYTNSSTLSDGLQTTPPGYIMGVENSSQVPGASTWHIDYFRVTLWPDVGIDPVMIVESVLQGILGAWVDEEKGRYGYTQTIKSGYGANIYYGGTQDLRYTLEFPGQACQFIGYEKLAAIYQCIARNSKEFHVTRIDTAFDEVPFSPREFMAVVMDPERVRSYFKREKIKFYDAPCEVDEAGNLGTTGVTIGGRSSTRYLRCYDKHGFNRLEVEYKAEKADQVAADLLLEGGDTVMTVAMGHLLDYIDIEADWWVEFKQEYQRLYRKLEVTPDIADAKKIADWLVRQAASAIAVLHELGMNGIDDVLLQTGRDRMYKSSRYAALINPPGARVRLAH